MSRTLSPAHLMWLALALPIAAAAQEPQAASPTTRLIPYSAVLPDAGLDATARGRTITFALFDDADGGTLLWSETQNVSVDMRGRFSAHLGASTPLPLEIFRSEQARWLEVSVNGRALPRTMLVAVPYALRAADAETLGGKPLADFVLTDGSGRRVRADGTTTDDPAVDGTGVPNQLAKWSTGTTLSSSILTESFDNRLGVLAPDPTGGGAVDSRFTIRNFDNNTAIGVLNPSNQRRFALNTLATGGWTLYDGGGGTWNAGLRQTSGRIGIGTAPSNDLVNVFQTTTSGSGLVVQVTAGASAWPAIQGITVGTGSGMRAVSLFQLADALEVEVFNTSSNLIFGRDNGTPRFRVNGAGQVFATGYTTGGADFAEEIEPLGAPDDYEAGDVLAIGRERDRTVVRTELPYTTTVIGIYSTQPGITASPYAMDDPRREGKLPVAMIGIVPCKVSAENGPIARGDLLVSAATPGHAMKGTDRARMTGAIVGKALAPLASGTGIILVAVTLQ